MVAPWPVGGNLGARVHDGEGNQGERESEIERVKEIIRCLDINKFIIIIIFDQFCGLENRPLHQNSSVAKMLPDHRTATCLPRIESPGLGSFLGGGSVYAHSYLQVEYSMATQHIWYLIYSIAEKTFWWCITHEPPRSRAFSQSLYISSLVAVVAV